MLVHGLRLTSHSLNEDVICYCSCSMCIPSLKFIGLPAVTVFIHLVTFRPWNWCAMSSVARNILPAILVLVQLFFVKLWANMHQTDDVTLQPWLDLWGYHTQRWCRSLYSISTPSLKFIDSLVPKKRLMFRHGIYSSGDLNLWPFDL